MKVFQKIKASAAFMCLAVSASAYSEDVPEWYAHQGVMYPSDFYITASGEGFSREEAEAAALASLSLYFQTTADVCTDLLKRYNETDSGSGYSLGTDVSISECARITSHADFFGVSFERGFFLDGKYMALAYLNRESVFAVYSQRIELNVRTLRSLLLVAEDFANPVSGFEAAREARPVAELTEQLVKMARLVKNVSASYFSEAEQLIERAKSAYHICKSELVFKVNVQNDYEGMVQRTISSLMEDSGYCILDSGGFCELLVTVTVDKENTEAGIFLYCGISAAVTSGGGKTVFSYSRNFPKKGAQSERMAYRRAFQAIQKELQETFMQEFSQKIKINE